jgi:hypothetical protein
MKKPRPPSLPQEQGEIATGRLAEGPSSAPPLAARTLALDAHRSLLAVAQQDPAGHLCITLALAQGHEKTPATPLLTIPANRLADTGLLLTRLAADLSLR